MALLAFVRYKRAMNPSQSQLGLITAAERIARRSADLPLLGQVHTSLGDELLARGNKSGAIAAYKLALVAFSQTEAPALAVWAERSLRWLEEMR